MIELRLEKITYSLITCHASLFAVDILNLTARSGTETFLPLELTQMTIMSWNFLPSQPSRLSLLLAAGLVSGAPNGSFR